MLVHRAAQNGVAERVAGALDLPPAEDKVMGHLGRHNRVEHNGQIAAGGVFQAHGHIAAAGHQAVELVFHRAGTHGNIGHNVRKVTQVFGIEHLVRSGKAGFLQYAHVHMADGQNSLQHIRLLFRVRLVDHSHVALAGGAGLVGVHARNDHQAVLRLLLHLDQTGHIIHNGFLVIRRAGADNDQELVAFAGNDLFDFFIPLFFAGGQFRRKGKPFPNDIRGRNFCHKRKSHDFMILSPSAPHIPALYCRAELRFFLCILHR